MSKLGFEPFSTCVIFLCGACTCLVNRYYMVAVLCKYSIKEVFITCFFFVTLGHVDTCASQLATLKHATQLAFLCNHVFACGVALFGSIGPSLSSASCTLVTNQSLTDIITFVNISYYGCNKGMYFR